MASYQDIDVRLKVIEDKLEFLMRIMRGRVVAQTGMLDAAGKPITKIIDSSLLDMYRFAQQNGMGVDNAPPTEQDVPSPEPDLVVVE